MCKHAADLKYIGKPAADLNHLKDKSKVRGDFWNDFR